MTTLTRRRFGVIAVTAPVWATPIIREVSVAGASQAASMGSRPRPTPRVPQSGPPAPSVAAKPVVTDDPTLPYTGDNELPVAAVGAAAVAAGAALIAGTRKPRGDRFGPCGCE